MTKKCNKCGKCCQFVAIPIPQPNIMDGHTIDYCKWIIAHKNMSLAVNEKNEWAIIVNDDCKYYDKINEYSGVCTIYNDRFGVCRMFDPNNCMGNANNSHWKTYDTENQFDREVNPYYEE